MKNDYLPISRVTKITGISEKRLRYYDQQKLCVPDYRDPDTGYRYYKEEQLPILSYISYLRLLNFPVSLISKLLKTKSLSELMGLKSDIDQQVVQATQDAQLANYRYEQLLEFRHSIGAGLSHIRSREQERPVSVMRTEPFSVIEYSKTMPFSELTNEARLQMFNHLTEQLQKYFFISVGGYAILFQNHPALLPASSKAFSLPIKISYHAQIKNPPSIPLEFIQSTGGILSATAIHIGPYETLSQTYELIIKWAKENGYALGTMAMEEHLITGQMVSSSELYTTQIFIPLTGSGF